LEADEAVSGETLPPLTDGVPVTAQLLGELLVGGRVVNGGA
jgi:hypothetical protein